VYVRQPAWDTGGFGRVVHTACIEPRNEVTTPVKDFTAGFDERRPATHTPHLRKCGHRQTAEPLGRRWGKHRIIIDFCHFGISPKCPAGQEFARLRQRNSVMSEQMNSRTGFSSCGDSIAFSVRRLWTIALRFL
jgi:hypothetical protein